MRDIAIDLSRSTSSLHSSAPSDGVGGNTMNRSSSARSLNAVISTSRTERMLTKFILANQMCTCQPFHFLQNYPTFPLLF